MQTRLKRCDMTLEFIKRRKAAHDTDFAQVARLIKFWVCKLKRENEGFRLKSFMIELVLAHLADQAPEGRTTDQIAAVTKVPRAYLSKLLQALCRKGVVQSHRGVGGGMTLVKTPAELTILEVVNAVEPIERIRTCPLGLAAHGVRPCPLHRRLDNALAMVEEAFGSTTLAEVLAEQLGDVLGSGDAAFGHAHDFARDAID